MSASTRPNAAIAASTIACAEAGSRHIEPDGDRRAARRRQPARPSRAQSLMSAATICAPAPAEAAREFLAEPARRTGDATTLPARSINDGSTTPSGNYRHPAGQTTWSVRGSIRCIWLRSATSGIVSPALPAAAGSTRPQTSIALDDEIHHRLHAHRLDDVELHRKRHRARRRVAAAFGDVLGTQPEQQLVAEIRAIARRARRPAPERSASRRAEPPGRRRSRPPGRAGNSSSASR